MQRSIQKRPQPMTPRRMPQLPQRLSLNLPNPLPRNREVLPDLFERMLAPILQPESHADNLLFARAQSLQNLRRLLAQIKIDHRFRWRYHAPVDNEIPQVRLFLLAHRSLQRNRLLRNPQYLAHLAHRQFHLRRKALR